MVRCPVTREYFGVKTKLEYMRKKPVIDIIGTGRMAFALMNALSHFGYQVSSVVGRNTDKLSQFKNQFNVNAVKLDSNFSSKADVVFLAVSDDAISDVAGILGTGDGNILVHTSGAQDVDILQVAEKKGWKVASFHPLQTIPEDAEPEIFRDVYISLCGNTETCLVLSKIAKSIGAHPYEVSSAEKQKLHVAAVLTSNYMAALVKAAETFLDNPTIKTEQLLGPLMEKSLREILQKGPDKALTGPISRGDIKTIDKHLQIIKKTNQQDLYELYKTLGRYALQATKDNNRLSHEKEKELEQFLK